MKIAKTMSPVAASQQTQELSVPVTLTLDNWQVTNTGELESATLIPVVNEDGGVGLSEYLPLHKNVGEYYVKRNPRAVTNHDSNDLNRAVTLILQLLPLISENTPELAATIPGLEVLTLAEKHTVTQLLLQAAYTLETASVTPYVKAKVDIVD